MSITSKEMVALVSERTGIPVETVTVIDRYLAEAGLRTRSLRGRGHTPMQLSDIANLFVATLGGGRPVDAASSVLSMPDAIDAVSSSLTRGNTARYQRRRSEHCKELIEIDLSGIMEASREARQ